MTAKLTRSPCRNHGGRDPDLHLQSERSLPSGSLEAIEIARAGRTWYEAARDAALSFFASHARSAFREVAVIVWDTERR